MSSATFALLWDFWSFITSGCFSAPQYSLKLTHSLAFLWLAEAQPDKDSFSPFLHIRRRLGEIKPSPGVVDPSDVTNELARNSMRRSTFVKVHVVVDDLEIFTQSSYFRWTKYAEES